MKNKFDDEILKVPSRNNPRYKEIEKYELYELTHCSIYEMAIRNPDVKKILHDIKAIELIQEPVRKFLGISVKHMNNPKTLTKSEEGIKKKYDEYETILKELKKRLKEKYFIYYNQSSPDIPVIENPFKKDISSLSIEEQIDEIQNALASPIVKHISSKINNEILTDTKKSDYKYDDNIYDGFSVIRGSEAHANSFNISNINTNFKRKIYDINQTNISINISLPDKEIEAYIKHIRETLFNKNSKQLKSHKSLLGYQTEEAIKTKNYPKNPTASKLADMLFVYDYVCFKLKEHETEEKLMKDEYIQNRKDIEESTEYTRKEKDIQIQNLNDEFAENDVTTKVIEILKNFDKKIKNIDFKSSTASNYYYAIKPYIDGRYPEFLTGESVLVGKNIEKSK